MTQTQKLLQSVVENARTGLDGCEQLVQRAEDPGIRDELMRQCQQYQNFVRDAERALADAGAKPHRKNPIERVGMWMGVQMNTMTDTSPSHIADMIIQGATMGVTEMTKDMNATPEADGNARGIASSFITAQQENIDKMKAFL